MRNYLDGFVVAILLRKDVKSMDIGSGTCIQIDTTYFVATAGHILKKAKRFSQQSVTSNIT
ncbi:MAG: hypothetical protein IIA61_02290 [Candidatus Marinimicrobia bacterium]|nr:hypothetical protein [Candidatus Neomarinimicrobiota bacterium]